ncbi:Abortive infection protein [Thermincola ferriacetica]|uniref:Abortive infection protein n=1 Tax=Thermincola ferriacetica TaxID=281456 RepID=A0A0L6VZF6_9FIRM|nr:type II CAAX endopeptidase family protein [Thermincola ferriacetica]KNZ68518.1 Abortive infection protein [Thermincola ferriacetica]
MQKESFLDDKKIKWSFVDIILVFVLLLILMGITRAYADNIRRIFGSLRFLGMEPKLTLFFFSAMSQAFYILVVTGIIFWFRKATLAEIGLTTHNFLQTLFIGVGGGFVLVFLILLLGVIMVIITKTTPPPQDVATYLLAMDGKWSRLLAFFLGSVMAPLSEEIYFRGMVYPVFRDRFGRLPGMVISGLIFSLMHRDLFRFIPIAVGGIGLAYLFERTKSLWASIFAHSTWNTVMLLLMATGSRLAP